MCAVEGCTDTTVTEKGQCSGTFYGPEGRYVARSWQCLQYRAAPATYNYNNAWQAFLCTFQVSCWQPPLPNSPPPFHHGSAGAGTAAGPAAASASCWTALTPSSHACGRSSLGRTFVGLTPCQ